MPYLTEMLARYPEDPSLYRIFVMLKSTSLLLQPLSDQDLQFINKALAIDSKNQSVRDAIVSVFSVQEDGFEKVKRLSESFPSDTYPHAAMASLYLQRGEQQKAIEWAALAARNNPSNVSLTKLTNDLINNKFDIRNYITFKFDISGILHEDR